MSNEWTTELNYEGPMNEPPNWTTKVRWMNHRIEPLYNVVVTADYRWMHRRIEARIEASASARHNECISTLMYWYFLVLGVGNIRCARYWQCSVVSACFDEFSSIFQVFSDFFGLFKGHLNRLIRLIRLIIYIHATSSTGIHRYRLSSAICVVYECITELKQL